jgi:hypothetical protein
MGVWDLQFREDAVEGCACAAGHCEDHPDGLPAQGIAEAAHGARVLFGRGWGVLRAANGALLRLALLDCHLHGR